MGSDDAFLFDRDRFVTPAQEPARDRGRVFDLTCKTVERWYPGIWHGSLERGLVDYVALGALNKALGVGDGGGWRYFQAVINGARGLFWLAVIGRVVRDRERERLRERAIENLAPGSSPEDWDWTHDGPRVAVFRLDCDIGVSTFTRDAIAPEVDPVEEAHAPTSIPPIASARRTPGESRALTRDAPL